MASDPEEMANTARRVKVDNQEVERQPLKDQLDAYDRAQANRQVAKKHFGVRRVRFKHGDTQ